MDTFEGISGLQSFSPGWGDRELLEKTLVGRRKLVDRLEELAIDGAGGANKHQRLIVGVRGSGKTHVLRVLHNRLWANEEVKKRLLIVYLLEDELGVASFLDFVVRMLRAIVRWYPERKELAADVEAICDMPSELQESHAVQLLLGAMESKDVLTIMENLGVTFGKGTGFGLEGQQKLRDFVQEHARFMIFASSQALVEGARKPDRPFYEFFKVIHLGRLSVEEGMDLLVSIASGTKNDDVVRFLKTDKGRGRMQAIYGYTGGNHRLLVTFYDFLTADSKAKLSKVFVEALNPLKPYYQEQMRSLSAQQQKIIQYLSLKRVPCAVKDIARGCLAAANTISSQLKGLLKKNFVNKIRQGRESHYEVTEELFRICYQADLEQEGAPVRLFVDFLASLYTAKELLIRHEGYNLLAWKLGNDGAIPFADEAKYYGKAISQYHPKAAATAADESGESKEPECIRSFFEKMEKAGAYQEIVEFSSYLGQERDAFVLHTEAIAHAHLGDLEKAKGRALEALEKDPNDVEAHVVLAGVLAGEEEGREEALKHARRAQELSPDDPRGWCAGGRVFARFERTDEAEAAYRKALDLDSKNVTALRKLGILVGNAGRMEEALGLFQRLNKAAPDNVTGWHLTGQAFHNLKRTEEAQAAYGRALELDQGNNVALERLGIIAFNAERYEEALGLFRRLNEAAPKYANGWALTGGAFTQLKRAKEAETAHRKALDLDPKNASALNNLGIVVGNAGGHEEAMGLFQRLNEVEPKYARGWALTGRAVEKLDRAKEAETAYRKALDLDPKDAIALERLGVLVGNAGQHKEALCLFQKLNESAPKYAGGWRLTGRALGQLDLAKEAETTYRKALDFDPDYGSALEELGILVGKTGRHEEALGLFQRLNEAAPKYTQGWALTGEALGNLGRHEEALGVFERVNELDADNAEGWRLTAVELEYLGREGEALEVFDKAIKLGADKGVLLNHRGEARRECGKYELAIADYEKSLEADSKGVWAWFNIVSANLALGKIERALEFLPKSLDADKNSKEPAGRIVVQSFMENCQALLEHAPKRFFASYLKEALEIVEKAGYLELFEESIPVTVFKLLKNHESIDEKRFASIVGAFEDVLSTRMDVRVAVRFLQVGIDHFKKQDRKALLRLTREERRTFCKELDITDPGAER